MQLAPRVHRSRAAPVLLVALVITACSGPATEPPAEQTPSRSTATPSGSQAPEGVAGPGTTGVPVGTTLEESGSLTITEAGAVVEGLDVVGCVVIAADDVTIRNTRVSCSDPEVKRAITTEGPVSGTVIEDVEVDGGGLVDIGVDVSRARLSRLDVHGVNDGVRLGGSIVLEDSWIHDLSRSDELHPDAVQGISATDVVIRGNTLDPREAGGGPDLGNAAIMLGSETEPNVSTNVVIEDNLMDGGNYSLNIRGDINAEGYVIQGNTFGDSSRYGPIISPSSVPVGDGNVMAGTGAEAEIDRP